MDRNTPQRPKTYSDVMNEWAAQRDFIGQSRSRVLHPRYDSPLPVKIFGYLWRLAVVVLAPAIVFGILVQKYGKSPDFNEDLQPVVLRYLGAAEGEATGINWQLDGRLNARTVEAKGGPDAFFHELKAKIITSHLPAPGIFRRTWVIPAVNVDQLSITLRTGAAGEAPVFESGEDGGELKMNPFLPEPDATPLKAPSLDAPPEADPETLESPSLLDDPPPAKEEEGEKKPFGSAAAPPPDGESPLRLTRAGFGINPDPEAIRVLHYRGANVDLAWGGAPVTAGALLRTVAELDQSPGGWTLTAAGGDFRQGWLRGLELRSLKAEILKDRMNVLEGWMTLPGEPGDIRLTGAVTFGDLPEADGALILENVPLHRFVTGPVSEFIHARVSGELKLSGSLNRSTGLESEGTLTVESGRITGLPLQRALQTLTGEDQLLQMPVRKGEITLKTRGGETDGGLMVEIPAMELDCGSLARVRVEAKYEQWRVAPPPAGTPRKSGKKTPSPPAGFALTGELRVGLAPFAMKKVDPAILERYFKQNEAEGDWHWITVPLTERTEETSRSLAEELTRVHAEAEAAKKK